MEFRPNFPRLSSAGRERRRVAFEFEFFSLHPFGKQERISTFPFDFNHSSYIGKLLFYINNYYINYYYINKLLLFFIIYKLLFLVSYILDFFRVK